MAAQAGANIVIRIGDSDASPVTFSVFGGLKSKTINFNGGAVDVTTSDSERWQEMLSGASIRSVDLTGAGVFKDSNADALINQMIVEGIPRMMQFDLPNFKRITGQFHCTKLTYAGNHDGAVTYDVSFTSSGAVSIGAL